MRNKLNFSNEAFLMDSNGIKNPLFFLGKIVRKRWSDRNSIFLNDVLGIAQMLITLNMTIIIYQ